MGSAVAAILGVMEPFTAVCAGVAALGERLTPQILCGVCLVVASVILVVTFPSKKKAA